MRAQNGTVDLITQKGLKCIFSNKVMQINFKNKTKTNVLL